MADAEFLGRLGLFVEPAFLDFASCDVYRAEMQSATGKPATVSAEAGDEVDETYRKTKRAQVSDETHAGYRERLLRLKPSLEEHFGLTLETLQNPQFLVYREGDFFRTHADAGEEEDAAAGVKVRQVSVVTFLNDSSTQPAPDSYGGGELTFYGLLGDGPDGSPIGIPLEAKGGQLVAFPSTLLHGVNRVTHGERFTIVSWFTLKSKATQEAD